ncbi:TPA: pilus assembly protein [Pseudomonas aeruginosa]
MKSVLHQIGKTSLAAALSGAVLLSAQTTHAAALSVSQQPLMLIQGVAPNMLVTLDDSGSMAYAYAPDSLVNSRNNVYFASNSYNPMYFDPNTQYKLPKKVTLSNGQIQVQDYSKPSFTAAWRNGFTQEGRVNLSRDYRPTVQYQGGSGAGTESSIDWYGAPAFYYQYSGGRGCSLTTSSCYTRVEISGAAQQQNFANWYSFYRTRALATQTAANLAFYSLPENARISWQLLNSSSCLIGSGSSNCYNNYLRDFTGQHRVNFFNWLENLSVGGGTPLRQAMTRAGEFLKKTGVNGPKWEGSTYSGGYDEIAAGRLSWPNASNNHSNNVYDLWHAAVNSRGEFFSADSPDQLVAAFQDILNRISGKDLPASRPAISSSLQEDDTGDKLTRFAYQTSFASDKNWAGDLTRYSLTTQDKATVQTKLWSAQSILDAMPNGGAGRKIMMAGSGTSGLKEFTWGSLSADQQRQLNRDPDRNDVADTKGQDRVAFLRGDRSKENSDNFRTRNSILGDIINSSPATVGKAQYLTYLAQPIEPSGNYSTFAEAQKTRAPRVYVGANDGMLHGFDTDGNETFAFIPSAVFEKLHKLTARGYQGGAHQFYVDGSPVVADAFFGGAWHTVLIGSLRAGGKGLFALDVTDPANIKLLWEIGVDQEPDLGYSFPKPTVARLHNGKWAVVTGNGYSSLNDKAALLIIDLETGAITRKLEVTGRTGVPNGLSSPRLADNNSDGVADYAYAGDLQGNLWRFDLIAGKVNQDDPFSRANDGPAVASSFRVSFGGQPLYSAVDSAGAAQAITAAPSLVRHPTRKGYIVIFGTGKYFENSDARADTSRAQTLYGIWDQQTKGEAAGSTPRLTRGNLQQQTLDLQADSTFASTARTIRIASQNPVNWLNNDGSTKQSGWYLDFMVNGTLKGEMLIEDMIAIGQVVLLQTITPNDDPCADGASNWTYGLDPYTGGRTSFTVFDLARQGVVDSKSDYSYNKQNVAVSGTEQKGLGGLTLSTNEQGNPEVCSSGECLTVNPGPNTRGRQNWRPIEGKN